MKRCALAGRAHQGPADIVRQNLDKGPGVAVGELAINMLQDLFILGCAHDPVSTVE
jgi:hypothetical protein